MAKAFPDEFRRDVVAVARKREAPLSKIAKDFGTGERTTLLATRTAEPSTGSSPPDGSAPSPGRAEPPQRARVGGHPRAPPAWWSSARAVGRGAGTGPSSIVASDHPWPPLVAACR